MGIANLKRERARVGLSRFGVKHNERARLTNGIFMTNWNFVDAIVDR